MLAMEEEVAMEEVAMEERGKETVAAKLRAEEVFPRDGGDAQSYAEPGWIYQDQKVSERDFFLSF
jgi:hypothetical protein